MFIFSGLSIRQKLITIILSVTVISVLGGLAIEIYNNILNSKNELVSNIAMDARLISNYSVPPLLFDDRKEAENTIDQLVNIPEVVYGVILSNDGNIFAEYLRDTFSVKYRNEVIVNDELVNNKIVKVSQKIHSGAEVLGEISVIASTEVIKQKTYDHIKSVLIVFGITLIIAIFLTIFSERLISEPILELASVSKKIRDSEDLTIRVKKRSDDETGVLYDSYNDLIESLERRKQERDAALEQLLAERQNLERRVEERTRELNVAKLKAEESDNLKSAFLANMSHEIRTPLNAILGFSNLLTDHGLTVHERAELQGMMETSARDLIKLIDDILDISRIEANQLELKVEEYSVNSLLREVFNVFIQAIRIDSPDSGVIPLLRIPEDGKDYIIITDALRFRQIFTNLLNNALKFTPEGYVELGYLHDDTSNTIIFYVKDTGIGIPFIKQDKIFDRFSKVADIKTKHYRGSGLGLAIVLKLTQMLKGRIWVDSEEGKGSVFYVSFSYDRIIMTGDNKSYKAEIHEDVSAISGKVIIIAEDVEWNYRFLEILLAERAGARLLWAKNGAEAVALCREHPETDLVLMDIQMPELNGLEATAQIRTFRPKLPIIAQTAYVHSHEKEQCAAAGCTAYLPKPVSKDNLYNLVIKVLMNSAADSEASDLVG
jgi:signal transduction histidine kinase/CheY-like chemotaxis protein